jgi:hypothetical protein
VLARRLGPDEPDDERTVGRAMVDAEHLLAP